MQNDQQSARVADPCDVCGGEADGDGTCAPCRVRGESGRFEDVTVTIPGHHLDAVGEGAWLAIDGWAGELGGTARNPEKRGAETAYGLRTLVAAITFARDLDALAERDSGGRQQREQDGEVAAPWCVLMAAVDAAIERERAVVNAETEAQDGRLEIETIASCTAALAYLLDLHDQLETREDPSERRLVRLSDITYSTWHTLAPSTVEAVRAMVKDDGVVMTSDYIVIQHYVRDRAGYPATPGEIAVAAEIEAADAIREPEPVA